MYDNIEARKSAPPGTFREIVAHPFGDDRIIEKAIIMEHRFAFFFWMEWGARLIKEGTDSKISPTLVTIDWHRDLAPPTNELKENLQKLDSSNLSDVANFVWARLDQTNDGHILCAAWLDLIGDVVLLKNSAGELKDTFTDMNGKQHRIFEFIEYERFEEFLLQRDDENIFFDIDLDYFVHGKGRRHYSKEFSRYSDEEIKKIINPEKPAFQHILPKIEGMTVALEPGYCGGISNACKIMDVVNSQFFNEENNWRHLSQES